MLLLIIAKIPFTMQIIKNVRIADTIAPPINKRGNCPPLCSKTTLERMNRMEKIITIYETLILTSNVLKII